MSEFKIGERVEALVELGGCFKKGATGTVLRPDYTTNYAVKVEWDEDWGGVKAWWSAKPEWLKLIKEKQMKYKVGEELTSRRWHGDIKIIATTTHNGNNVYTTIDDNGGYCAYDEDELADLGFLSFDEPVEMTIAEVAKKLDIDVKKLRIKD